MLRRGDEVYQKCQGLDHLAKPNVVSESLDLVTFPSKGQSYLRREWNNRAYGFTILYACFGSPCNYLGGFGLRKDEVIEK